MQSFHLRSDLQSFLIRPLIKSISGYELLVLFSRRMCITNTKTSGSSPTVPKIFLFLYTTCTKILGPCPSKRAKIVKILLFLNTIFQILTFVRPKQLTCQQALPL